MTIKLRNKFKTWKNHLPNKAIIIIIARTIISSLIATIIIIKIIINIIITFRIKIINLITSLRAKSIRIIRFYTSISRFNISSCPSNKKSFLSKNFISLKEIIRILKKYLVIIKKSSKLWIRLKNIRIFTSKIKKCFRTIFSKIQII